MHHRILILSTNYYNRVNRRSGDALTWNAALRTYFALAMVSIFSWVAHPITDATQTAFFFYKCIGVLAPLLQLSLMQTEVEPPRLEFILCLRWGWLRLFPWSLQSLYADASKYFSTSLVAPMTTTCSRSRWQPSNTLHPYLHYSISYWLDLCNTL